MIPFESFLAGNKYDTYNNCSSINIFKQLFWREGAEVSSPLFPYRFLLRQPDVAKGSGCICRGPQPTAKGCLEQADMLCSCWCQYGVNPS